ncbi:MAG: hypothetical protein IJV22_03125 [Bacteroidales bacterium]|nr:hypothetical protein [Bacteroidales bacterium]
MNTTFQFERFKKVVVRDARHLWPQFGLTMLIVVLLPMALWLFGLAIGHDVFGNTSPVLRWVEIYIICCLVAILAPSRMYRTCNVRGEGIHFAMLPASHLEKFLSMVLYSFIICPLLALVASIVVDTLLWILPVGSYSTSLFGVPDWYGLSETWKTLREEGVDVDSLTIHSLLLFVLSTLASVSTFFFTNTIFTKHKVLKTFLWGWLIGFVLNLFLMPFMLHHGASLGDWILHLSERMDEDRVVRLLMWATELGYLVWTVAWLVWSYVRLKRMPY